MKSEPPAPPPLLVPESDDQFGRPTRGTWLMIVMLLIVKIGGLIVVFAIDPSELAALFAVVTTWLWLVILGILLGGPAVYAWRVRRVRARRAELQRAEWMVDTEEVTVDR
jgi:membrane protein YdbS with pleckstrin-like domain